jgi:hypothetical protein
MFRIFFAYEIYEMAGAACKPEIVSIPPARRRAD